MQLGPKDAFPPETRGKLLFEDEPGKKPEILSGIFIGMLFIFSMVFLAGLLLTGHASFPNPVMLLSIVVICSMMGVFGALMTWVAILSDKFRVYSGGITLAQMRRLPDGRWSSFYPGASIVRIGYEDTPLAIRLVLVFSDRGRDGTVREEKTELSDIPDSELAEKALRDAFPDRWTETSKKFFEKTYEERQARKAAGRSTDRAFSWMFGLTYAAWVIGMLPIFWPLLPEPGEMYMAAIGAILAALAALAARGLVLHHREYRKGMTRKARLASDGIEIPRTAYQRLFTDKPSVFPLGWVRRVAIFGPPEGQARYCTVEFSFGERYELPAEVGRGLAAAVPLVPAGEGALMNAGPVVPERPPGLRPGRVAAVAGAFLSANIVLGYLLFGGAVDDFTAIFDLVMVLMIGFFLGPVIGIPLALLALEADEAVRPGVSAQDIQPRPDWGPFIDEEGPEDAARLRRLDQNAGWANIALGMLILAPGLFTLPFLLADPRMLFGPFGMVVFMDIFFFIVPALLVPAGIGGVLAAVRRRPWRMYESGLLDFNRASGKGVFIPYERFSAAREIFSYRYGKVFQLSTGNAALVLLSASSRTRWRVGFIQERTGKPALDPEALEVKRAEVERNTSWTFLWLLGGLGLSALFAGLLAQLILVATHGDIWRLAILLYPAICAPTLAFSLLVDYSPGLRRRHPKRFNARLTMPIFAIPAAVLLLALPLTGGFNASGFHGIQPGVMPESSVTVPDLQENVTAELFDNLVIRSGQTKTMRNCNFTFQCREWRQYQLWIEEGGTLIAENCTFRGGTGHFEPFGVVFQGRGFLRDCRIRNLIHAENNYAGQGGLEIWGTPVEMYNCSVCGTFGMGLLISDASPRFVNCTFASGFDEFVAAYRSAPVFQNCTFRHVGTAVAAWDQSRVTLENCTIDRAFDTGVFCEGSEVVLRGCVVKDIGGFAFELYPPGSIQDHSSVLENVSGRLFEGMGLAFFDAVCSGANIVSVILCPAVVWSYIGRHEQAFAARPGPDL